MAQQPKVVKVGPGGRSNGPRPKVENPGKVFSSADIYRRVWKDEPFSAEGTVPVHIRHLREKLEIDPANPRYLKVVWGKGYKLEEMKNEKADPQRGGARRRLYPVPALRPYGAALRRRIFHDPHRPRPHAA